MAKAKPEPPKDAKASKQSTLASFFGKPKPGPNPRPAAPSTSSPASTQLHTPSSVAGSSPLTSRASNGASSSSRKREGSPLKKSHVPDEQAEEESDGLSPPPPPSTLVDSKGMESRKRAEAKMELDVAEEQEEVDVGMAVDGSPIVMGRRAKRKVIYVDPDSDEDSDGGAKPVAGTSKAGRKPRKSLKEDSDDEFQFDEIPDEDMALAAEDFEASTISGSPSIASSPAPRSRKPAKGSASTLKKANNASWASPSSAPARPPPKPLARPSSSTLLAGEELDSRRAGSASSLNGSNSFLLTAAERRKLQEKQDKRENEQCFDFLRDVRDKQKRRPTDPEYDPRTIYIPPSAWDSFSPFEAQFWRIKQDHYDTVLFFQKGKFYELYEDDALKGHQEFDLKLTDRVKMKMVGVPEQSFEFWASKFLGAGYKVGKVDQAETAIGMEMRKKGPTHTDSKEDKIVRRELNRVFTNGTIVDGTYLTSDEANHCVSIKELPSDDPNGHPSFGICTLDASTGQFDLSLLDGDACRTKLETFFRQIRPKELLHEKGNLSPATLRLLRLLLPAQVSWNALKPKVEFYPAQKTLQELSVLFETEHDEPGSKPELPDPILKLMGVEVAMEALGGMLWYLKSLNLDKDLVSQRNFNIYDPIREGKNLVLDGQTLGHMEVLVNSEGGIEGTLLELLQRCQTPFGKRLFKIWLTSPLRDVRAINDRLDAVDDLMAHPTFSGQFTTLSKGLPDLERLISRIHAGSVKQTDFLKVVDSFTRIQSAVDALADIAEGFESRSVAGLLRSAPDLHSLVKHVRGLYTIDQNEKTIAIMPTRGADAECDDADEAVDECEGQLDSLLEEAKRKHKLKDAQYWHSAQGGKEIFQIQVSASAQVPRNWTKQSGTKNYARYYTPETLPEIRKLQEARETQSAAKRMFFRKLMAEFDKDRSDWLKMVRMIAELDCLVSLAKASSDMDQPKCRPTFLDPQTHPSASIDFEELRHPSMCLRADFIANDVKLGGVRAEPRQVLLTGPNMAGKSTLLRMTAAGVILAQMGCYVPAAKAVLGAMDRIQTRMGAYDNMFASASTFKVELDECSKILREAGPRSLVILDELGRGTSTYDGMAIAGAVLHHLATHTLPLGFFATHYGALTDDFTYHPNVRKMHMQARVDEELGQVLFLYKLIDGVAESSHGTNVAKMAGVPDVVIRRADAVSAEFFAAFKEKLAGRRQSALPLVAQADYAWLMKVAMGLLGDDGTDGHADKGRAGVKDQMDVIRRAIGRYESC